MTIKRSKAEILLELLDRVPKADVLEYLLETENLLRLYLLYGGDPDEMRDQLAEGKLPGEFLLEVLDKESDVRTLLLQINPDTRQHWWTMDNPDEAG
ncbi:MAG: hypothetical protein ACLFU8_09105 [Anaerolineales bacterium]